MHKPFLRLLTTAATIPPPTESMATIVNVIFHSHQNNCFTKILLTPPPIPRPITLAIMPPKSRPLNPDAEPFYPQQRLRVPEKRNSCCHRKFPRTEWRVKGQQRPLQSSSTSRRPNVIPFPYTIEEAEALQITTIMIRNIPNQYKFEDLIFILDEHCFDQNKTTDDPTDWSKFDFVYLPMDYRKHAVQKRMSNLGYAFVNFTSPSAAFKFYQQFEGFAWNVTENRKICEISTAQHQGKDNLMRIFSKKVFRCESREFLPVVFSDGRDGLNRRTKGKAVGKHVWGLPALPLSSIGTRAYFQNHC